MEHGYIFGYGSLVNRRTHGYAETASARLRGWRRTWRHTALRPLAFLTAVPDEACEIDGLVARIEGPDWTSLYERERAYDRVPALEVTHALSHRPPVEVFAIPEGKHAAATDVHPVLLSYIDTVVQGFHDVHGETGVRRFFDTTTGWNAPIADDRAAPIYGRHQALAPGERDLVDDSLARLGCRFVRPPGF